MKKKKIKKIQIPSPPNFHESMIEEFKLERARLIALIPQDQKISEELKKQIQDVEADIAYHKKQLEEV